MGNKINININNLFSISADCGISISEIAHEYKKVTGKPTIGCKIGNEIVEFDTIICEDTNVEFFDYTCHDGNKMYQSGLKMILALAVKELWNKKVSFKYSLDKGIYAVINKRLTDLDIFEIQNKMLEIANYDFPIKKCITKKDDAINYFKQIGDTEKAFNIQNLSANYVVLYEINHSYNYFYSDMPASTGEMKIFDITRLDANSIVLTYPRIYTGAKLPSFFLNEKIYAELVRYNTWSKKMNIEYAEGINRLVSDSNIQMFIKKNNIYINDYLYTAAKNICRKNKTVKLVLIGGPSSSGKTTTAKKLCTFLETYGVNPIIISADDYFKERTETPKDENGEYDYESLNALDLKLFNKQLKALLNGEEVVVPTFNFVTGQKEYNRKPIKMGPNNILLIEGLHCLNDAMTTSIKRENKYKIYVSPLTPLGIDCHNHLSTTDMRLIRRIVRDNRVRGRNVIDTLQAWTSVKAGEEKYIYPYTSDVDLVVNSAFAYEIGVLKVFAEPLLRSISIDSPYYADAQRLLDILRIFFPISSEYIEDDNILREFIGGSIYE